MLPETNEVCVARREAHEPLLVLDHRVEEVADGEVPAVRRPEDLSRTIIAGDQDNRGPIVSDEAVEFVAAQGRGAPPLEPALVELRVARGDRSSERRPGVRSAAARQAAHTGRADP